MVYYIVTVKIPAYFQDVFNMPIASNGSITALAGVAILTSKFLCLKMSTFLLNRNPMSITNFRKTFQSLATLIPGLCLFAITLRNDDQVLATCLVFVAMFGAGELLETFFCFVFRSLILDHSVQNRLRLFGRFEQYGRVREGTVWK